MRNLIGIIFAISDLIAWILLFVSAAGAVIYPFTGPIHEKIVNHALSIESVALTAIISLVVAIGSYLLIRRKRIGLPLVLVPCIKWGFAGSYQIELWYGVIVLIVFGTPFVLSYIEMKHVSGKKM